VTAFATGATGDNSHLATDLQGCASKKCNGRITNVTTDVSTLDVFRSPTRALTLTLPLYL
jgi:hypothetical protein